MVVLVESASCRRVEVCDVSRSGDPWRVVPTVEVTFISVSVSCARGPNHGPQGERSGRCVRVVASSHRCN
ncbi:unnamed protein product [Toxocara canis]|uniref:Uncharacterized protein n=1 Tax=Toxocara canis TaxID=6265 RepID=A0A183UKF1_TOXCA|nr:unnamed protein product [Toxocara canis]